MSTSFYYKPLQSILPHSIQPITHSHFHTTCYLHTLISSHLHHSPLTLFTYSPPPHPPTTPTTIDNGIPDVSVTHVIHISTPQHPIPLTPSPSIHLHPLLPLPVHSLTPPSPPTPTTDNIMQDLSLHNHTLFPLHPIHLHLPLQIIVCSRI